MQAIAYLRRSKKSDERTVSLEEQEESVRAYACLQGFTLSCVISDDGVSGGDRSRFSRIFDALEKTGAKVVLCYHIDRFARDVAALLDTVKEYKKRRIELWVVDRGKIETDKSSDFLLLGVEGIVAQYVRMVTGEKTKAALGHLKKAGRRYSGKPPYGFEFEGNRLMSVEDEQRTLELIGTMRDWPTRRLKRFLELSGIWPRKGNSWSLGTLWNLQKTLRERDDAIIK